MNKRYLGAAALAALTLAGCGQNEAPVTMAPPTTPVTISQGAGGGGGQMTYSPDQVFPWNQTPANQQIPIVRATFDQGGYQLFDNTGDTIVIPFQNQNMYVMKFGRSDTGAMYFVNDGQVPTLYVPNGGALENASAQGARWYPFPQNYAYTQPVYVGLAPSWSAFTGMGWYPGMSYYGGYAGLNPYGYGGFAPMIGLHFLIGGHPYYGFNSYHSYYTSHPYNAVRTRNVYNNYTSFRSSAPFGARRSTFGNSGSYGSRPSGGGFGRTSSGGGFGRPSGSFGGGSSTFGNGGRQTGGSFGSRPSGYGGSFGTGRRTFGGSSGGSSFGGSRPSGGGSFGGFGGRSSGGGSFGGGSFGGGRSFGGGSFGGRRR